MKLTESNKNHIDSLSYKSLLSRWRLAHSGDEWFQGETGIYWGQRMSELLALHSPSLLAITGSHLYGVATETSDVDRRGFVVPPKDYLYGLKKFEQYEDPDEDTVIYSLKKFFELLCNGNTQAIEVLFSNNIEVCDPIGQAVIDNRDIFISQRYYRSIKGFAFAEYRKARAVRLHIEDKEDIIQILCSSYNLKRFQRDALIDLIEEYTGKTIKTEYSSVPQLGKARKLDVEKHGYSLKNAYHTIRLLCQGAELLEYGTITYPRQEVSLLKEIRKGGFSKEFFETIYLNALQVFEEAYDVTTLPKAADMERVNKLYMELCDASLSN